jgi:two-component system response regulator (stage 0 sporulation protein F)
MKTHRVLIVDDQHDVRHMLASSLQTFKQEVDVIQVPSAEEAMLVSSRMTVDLLVVDVRLPGMSGLELTERIRNRNPGIKIILITGLEDQDIRRQVAEAGADAYFYKPIDMVRFLDIVEQSLKVERLSEPVADIEGVPELQVVPVLEEESFPNLADRLSTLCQETKGLLSPRQVISLKSRWNLH